jgi:hypothetical protein
MVKVDQFEVAPCTLIAGTVEFDVAFVFSSKYKRLLVCPSALYSYYKSAKNKSCPSLLSERGANILDQKYGGDEGGWRRDKLAAMSSGADGFDVAASGKANTVYLPLNLLTPIAQRLHLSREAYADADIDPSNTDPLDFEASYDNLCVFFDELRSSTCCFAC